MLFDLLKKARALNASDVHLAVGLVPRVRVQGALQERGRERWTRRSAITTASAIG